MRPTKGFGGEWIVLDFRKNTIYRDVDLEDLGRRIGALDADETIVT